jgi:uncharacterized protein YuzE
MKIRYFQNTDTLYIEFKAAEVAETRDLDENTLLDLDREILEAASISEIPERKNGVASRGRVAENSIC